MDAEHEFEEVEIAEVFEYALLAYDATVSDEVTASAGYGIAVFIISESLQVSIKVACTMLETALKNRKN